MAEGRPTPKSVFCLVGSYALAFALAVFGVLFALVVWKLDSPWAAFGLHASWNFTQTVLLGLPNSGGTTPFVVFGVALGTTPVAGFAYDLGFGIEGSAMATVVLLAGCALVWWLGERRNVTPTDIWAGESAANFGGATAAGGAVPTGASAAEKSSIS